MGYRKYFGQAMIEAVVAFAVVMVVLVALLQLSNRSVTNSGEASRQALATSYATEGLQWLKREKIINSFEIITENCPSGTCNICFNNLEWDDDCLVLNISGTEFIRTLKLENPAPGQITATVTVSWPEAGRTASSRQSFTFVNR